jgi:hypothetical protein
MLHAFDARDWPRVRQAFTENVDVDYSSLFGVPASRTTADELVGGWARFISVFDATQHMTGAFVVSPSGEGLHATTHVRAYHRMKEVAGGEIWMVAGHYELLMKPHGEIWKIAGITLRVLYQGGNLNLPAVAAERLASSRVASDGDGHR